MASNLEIKKIRLEKLKAICSRDGSAYPIKTNRTHSCVEAVAKFAGIVDSEKQVCLVGRIKSLRVHGGSAFFHFTDGSGSFQAYLKKDGIGEKFYQYFLENFDIGDFIEVRGTLFETRRQEKTIEVADFKMLSKALLPLPEKWHGLKDVEERYRKRYLDLIFNTEIKKKFVLRSRIIKEIRNFLEGEGFMEVETPILQPIYGGASAKPFKTHLNALDIDLYLRIAPELYLKRLLVGGFEKVYEIGKCFRNEGIDKQHNPDFSILEFYWAYADYKDLMKMTEKMFAVLIKNVFNKMEIEHDGKVIDFSPPWPRIEFSELIRKYTKIDLDKINEKALAKKAKELGVKVEKGSAKSEIADEIYKKFCRPKLWNPIFIIHHPADFKPLAKTTENDPGKSANFQLVAGGCELVNAYSELNDPIEQKKQFQNQEKMFKSGFEDAQRIDEDYIEALEYGMPPAAGLGMGIDRLVALLTDSRTLREIIFFPIMKNKKN